MEGIRGLKNDAIISIADMGERGGGQNREKVLTYFMDDPYSTLADDGYK